MYSEALRNNQQQHRFELDHEGHTAILSYRQNKGSKRIYLVHTEVPTPIRNQGVGQRLIREVLEYIRETGLKVVPLCPLVVAYLKRHPDYFSLIDDSKKADFS